jgi:hypothetical protein
MDHRHRFAVATCAALLLASVPTSAASESPGGALARKHQTAGVTCAKCHGATTPSKPKGRDASLPRLATKGACLECHGSYEAVAAKTVNYHGWYNPHVSHYGDLECYQCHRVHGTSELFCTRCHLDMKLPKSWKTTKNPADE